MFSHESMLGRSESDNMQLAMAYYEALERCHNISIIHKSFVDMEKSYKPHTITYTTISPPNEPEYQEKLAIYNKLCVFLNMSEPLKMTDLNGSYANQVVSSLIESLNQALDDKAGTAIETLFNKINSHETYTSCPDLTSADKGILKIISQHISASPQPQETAPKIGIEIDADFTPNAAKPQVTTLLMYALFEEIKRNRNLMNSEKQQILREFSIHTSKWLTRRKNTRTFALNKTEYINTAALALARYLDTLETTPAKFDLAKLIIDHFSKHLPAEVLEDNHEEVSPPIEKPIESSTIETAVKKPIIPTPNKKAEPKEKPDIYIRKTFHSTSFAPSSTAPTTKLVIPKRKVAPLSINIQSPLFIPHAEVTNSHIKIDLLIETKDTTQPTAPTLSVQDGISSPHETGLFIESKHSNLPIQNFSRELSLSTFTRATPSARIHESLADELRQVEEVTDTNDIKKKLTFLGLHYILPNTSSLRDAAQACRDELLFTKISSRKILPVLQHLLNTLEATNWTEEQNEVQSFINELHPLIKKKNIFKGVAVRAFANRLALYLLNLENKFYLPTGKTLQQHTMAEKFIEQVNKLDANDSNEEFIDSAKALLKAFLVNINDESSSFLTHDNTLDEERIRTLFKTPNSTLKKLKTAAIQEVTILLEIFYALKDTHATDELEKYLQDLISIDTDDLRLTVVPENTTNTLLNSLLADPENTANTLISSLNTCLAKYNFKKIYTLEDETRIISTTSRLSIHRNQAIKSGITFLGELELFKQKNPHKADAIAQLITCQINSLKEMMNIKLVQGAEKQLDEKIGLFQFESAKIERELNKINFQERLAASAKAISLVSIFNQSLSPEAENSNSFKLELHEGHFG